MLPEPPNGTRLEFEHWTDVYAVWRDDESSRVAGWRTGDAAGPPIPTMPTGGALGPTQLKEKSDA
jgi:hypothetical protein